MLCDEKMWCKWLKPSICAKKLILHHAWLTPKSCLSHAWNHAWLMTARKFIISDALVLRSSQVNWYFIDPGFGSSNDLQLRGLMFPELFPEVLHSCRELNGETFGESFQVVSLKSSLLPFRSVTKHDRRTCWDFSDSRVDIVSNWFFVWLRIPEESQTFHVQDSLSMQRNWVRQRSLL